jgi:hypothetical protein
MATLATMPPDSRFTPKSFSLDCSAAVSTCPGALSAASRAGVPSAAGVVDGADALVTVALAAGLLVGGGLVVAIEVAPCSWASRSGEPSGGRVVEVPMPPH